MKSPAWEVSPGALAALLNGIDHKQLRKIDLYTITLRDGTVLRYSGGDEPVRLGTTLWILGPVLKRTNTRTNSTLEVDTCDVTFSAPPGFTVNGTPLIEYITNGGFDNARLRLDRAFSAGVGQPWQGSINRFSGGMGASYGGRHGKKVESRSDVELLNIMIPRNVYQPGCLNSVFDSDCGVDRDLFALTGEATSGLDALGTTFSHDLAGLDVDELALGEVLCTAGANIGLRRTIAANLASNVTVIDPWPFAVAVGDEFTFWPGCDGQLSTCDNRYDNRGHFRGMPFVPAAETVT